VLLQVPTLGPTFEGLSLLVTFERRRLLLFPGGVFLVSVRLVRFWSCISVERYKSCLFCFLCTLYNLHISSRDSLTCHDVARIPYMCLCYNTYISWHNTLSIPQPPFYEHIQNLPQATPIIPVK
jgi:hypothetical protein